METTNKKFGLNELIKIYKAINYVRGNSTNNNYYHHFDRFECETSMGLMKVEPQIIQVKDDIRLFLNFQINNGDYIKIVNMEIGNEEITNIKVTINNQQFYREEIEISNFPNNRIKIIVQEKKSPDGMEEVGKFRMLHYYESLQNGNLSAEVKEKDGYNDSRSIRAVHDEWDGVESSLILTTKKGASDQYNNVEDEVVKKYVHSLLSHPRSKAMFAYIEEEMEREIPGLMDLIKEYFPFYITISGLEYQPTEDFENVFKEFILPACDLPKKKDSSLVLKG